MSNNRIAGWAIVGRGDDRRRIKQGTARYSGHEWYFHDLKGEHFSWCYPWRPGWGDETELDWLYSSQAAALTALLELLTAEIQTLEEQRQAVEAGVAVLRGAPRQEGFVLKKAERDHADTSGAISGAAMGSVSLRWGTNMNDETFGQTLRRLRQEAGHSQRWLAEQVEIDHTYLSKIENGRVEPPSYKTINKIARALGTNMDVLAALAGPIANLHFRVAKSEQEIRNWTETARQYATNSVYWEKRALHAEGLVKSLIGAMERWGADEDGIPEEACDIVAEAVIVRLREKLSIYSAALEPFARMFRWTNLPSTDDDAQVFWRKHWLTGERMKLTTEQFRLAALAFYHGGVSPDIPDGEQQLAVAMAEEMDRWDKVKAMQAALDEFEEEDCD